MKKIIVKELFAGITYYVVYRKTETSIRGYSFVKTYQKLGNAKRYHKGSKLLIDDFYNTNYAPHSQKIKESLWG